MSRNKKSDYVWNEIYGEHLTGGGRSPFKHNAQEVELATLELMYLRLLTEMSVNRFKWIGLPDTINERFLELVLFRQGLAVWFRHPVNGELLALRGASQGPLNMYDEPTSFLVIGNASFTGLRLSADDCVPIWSNFLRTPDLDIVTIYSKRLAQLDRSIDINSRNARRSKVIVAEENQRLSATNINNELDRGSPVIQVNAQGMNLLENITAVDMGVEPDGIEKLQAVRTKVWNDCMGLLGLNFANQDKRERMVVDEVSANDEQVGNMRRVHLNERKRACREINKRYGLSIDVKYHVDVTEPIENTYGEM